MEHPGAQNTPSRTHHYNGGGGGGGGREDCWSEGATAVLIEAWGDRYLQLSRGNLRQKDWKDVADAVNGRADGTKPRRTDIQCKNRIDTIKKKYKLEKSKPAPSQWPFYGRLDHLIGTATATPGSGSGGGGGSKKILSSSAPPPPTASFYKPPPVTFTVNKHLHHGKGKFYSPNPNLNHPNLNHSVVVYSGGSSSKSRLNSPVSTESSGGVGVGEDEDDEEEDEDVEDDENHETMFRGDGSSRKHRMDRDREVSNGTAFRELAKAVVKFGEIYERIENSKQQQMMELERQRMEFTKDLEFQRMQMFMDAQLELEKMKRPKYASTAEANAWLFLT